MPWHPGAGAGCSEQRPGGTVALGYIHTYILGGARYRDAVGVADQASGARRKLGAREMEKLAAVVRRRQIPIALRAIR